MLILEKKSSFDWDLFLMFTLISIKIMMDFVENFCMSLGSSF